MSELLELAKGNTIFHYTNLLSFKSIIESGEMWFTRVDFLKNSKEFIDFNEQLESVYIRKVSQFNYEYDKSIIQGMKKKWFDKVRASFYKKSYNCSFCKDGDYIPMWNYYLELDGISIGMNSQKLMEVLNSKNSIQIRKYEVIYSQFEK